MNKRLDYFRDFWNVLDITNISLFALSIVMRIRYVYLIYSNTLVVPASEYKVSMPLSLSLSVL